MSLVSALVIAAVCSPYIALAAWAAWCVYGRRVARCVQYPDGHICAPTTLHRARSLRRVFGGKVIRVPPADFDYRAHASRIERARAQEADHG